MSGELKPCPFCGGKPLLRKTSMGIFIQCLSEGCTTKPSTVQIDSSKDVIKYWNTRYEDTEKAHENPHL